MNKQINNMLKIYYSITITQGMSEILNFNMLNRYRIHLKHRNQRTNPGKH